MASALSTVPLSNTRTRDPLAVRAAQFLHLVLTLTGRDLRVRYKQSILGVLWAVLVPLSMMGVFTFVLSRSGVADQRPSDMPYPVYAYIGLTVWTFFSSSLTNCVTSLTSNRTLVTKVQFPREAFPLSAVLAASVDAAIAIAVGGVLLFLGFGSSEWSYRPGAGLLLLPLIAGTFLALTTGLGLLLAMAQLFFRDVKPLFTVVLQLALFVSGVVVPLPAVDHWAARALSLNPVAFLIDALRESLVHGSAPDAAGFACVALASAGILAGALAAFRSAAHLFAETI